MISDGSLPVYTADELLAIAAQNGLVASNRLILDWVSLGLLDRSERRGLGRGKGSTAVWNHTQAELFIDLLALRQRENDAVRRVAGLANLPVVGWLYGSPGVPLRQVRLALGTWSGRHRQKRNSTNSDAARTASQFVKTVSHPEASVSDRADLRQLVIHSLKDRNSYDAAALRNAVRRCLDPRNEGPQHGPAGMRIDSELYVGLTEARFVAIRDLETFTDADYETARTIYVRSRAGYAKDQPQLARDRKYGHHFERPTFEGILNGACVDLITILGMGRTARPPDN